MIAAPCAAFFVTLDRFLALKLGLHYTPSVQRRFGYVSSGALLLLYAFSIANVLIAWPYNGQCIDPGTETNPIGNRPCLPLLNKIVNYTQQSINVCLSIANIVIAIVFVKKLIATKIPNVVSERKSFVLLFILTTFLSISERWDCADNNHLRADFPRFSRTHSTCV